MQYVSLVHYHNQEIRKQSFISTCRYSGHFNSSSTPQQPDARAGKSSVLLYKSKFSCTFIECTIMWHIIKRSETATSSCNTMQNRTYIDYTSMTYKNMLSLQKKQRSMKQYTILLRTSCAKVQTCVLAPSHILFHFVCILHVQKVTFSYFYHHWSCLLGNRQAPPTSSLLPRWETDSIWEQSEWRFTHGKMSQSSQHTAPLSMTHLPSHCLADHK